MDASLLFGASMEAMSFFAWLLSWSDPEPHYCPTNVRYGSINEAITFCSTPKPEGDSGRSSVNDVKENSCGVELESRRRRFRKRGRYMSDFDVCTSDEGGILHRITLSESH